MNIVRVIVFIIFCIIENVYAGQIPQDYTISNGTQLTTASVASLTLNALNSGNATVAVTTNTDPTYIRPSTSGTSIKWEVTAGGTGFTVWNLDWTINTTLLGVTRLSFAYYVDIPGSLTNWNVAIFVSETSSYANRYNYSPFTIAPNVAHTGWNLATVDIATPSSTTGVPDRANTFQRIRLQMQVPAGQVGAIYLGPMYTNRMNAPKIVFSFDDNPASQYTEAYPYLNSRGLKGSMAIQTGFTGGVTVAQMQQMYASGWSFHNHTATHANLTLLTVSQILSEVGTAQQWLIGNGLLYGLSTMVYPNGATNSTVENTIGTLGITYGATTVAQINKVWDGVEINYRLYRQATDIANSLASLKTVVDNTIKFGGCTIFYTHAILVGATGSNTEVATFEGLVDYVKRLHDANIVEVVTLQGLIDGINGMRQRR